MTAANGNNPGQYEFVKTWRDGPIARISLNRPEKHNAKNLQLINELHAAVQAADGDPETRVLVLSGEGKSFCSGHDVSEVDFDPKVAAMYASPETRLELERDMYVNKSLAIRNTRKPTIAQIHGYCLGAGMMTMAMCDLIVAGEDAKFAMPVLSRFAAAGELSFEMWDIGARRAKEFLFLGEPIDARTALNLGFINRVVPNAELEQHVRELALKISNQPPITVELTKASINKSLDIMGQRDAWEQHFITHVFSHFTDEARNERARRVKAGSTKAARRQSSAV